MTENLKPPPSRTQKIITPERKLILPKRFDNVTKRTAHGDPEAFVTKLLGIDADEFEVIETEQLSMKTHLADSFILVTIRRKKVIVHCEFQTYDSRSVPMPFRMAGYIGCGIEFYKLPIYSHVIYLHPSAGLNDKGYYLQEIPRHNILIQYRVLRLCEMDGQALLDANRISLVPFAGLMKPPPQVDVPQWIRRCVQAIEAGAQDELHKTETLSDLAVLCGLGYDSKTIRDVILEETVQESSIIQYFTEKALAQGREEGIEQGREEGIEQGIQLGIQQSEKRNARKAVLALLAARFQPTVAQRLKPFLEVVEDAKHLDGLLHIAAQAHSVDDFTRVLLDIEQSTL